MKTLEVLKRVNMIPCMILQFKSLFFIPFIFILLYVGVFSLCLCLLDES